tara:strand:- start:159 stop:482 length:324 start_codon:yes stop_codon:yes gene_type:complete
MKYKLIELKKENDLNRILRKQKREKGEISILFTSLWDKYSKAMVGRIKSKYKNSDSGTPLYLVDSYNMPHSFVIFNSSRVPHLVTIQKNRVLSEEYLPLIYKLLELE